MQSLDQLLQAMGHYDKDNRFMAASDLTLFLLQNSALEACQEGMICAALLKQLEDSSIEVQGNAIKCIGRLMSVFKATEASAIIAKVVASMVEGVEDLRDVFATGFKTFLPVISPSLAEVVFAAVFPRTLAVCKTPDKFSLATKEHVLDVATEVVRRFGVPATWRPQMEVFPALLFEAVATAASVNLRRRCVGLLGALAANGDVDQIMQSLAEENKRHRSSSRPVDRLTLTKCLAAVSRSAGDRIGQVHLSRVMPLFLDNLSSPSDDATDELCEVIEVSLAALETLVRLGPRVQTFLPVLLSKLVELVKFDPFGYSEGVEDDGGSDEEFFDEDDVSWKLRRGAAAALAALAKSEAGVELHASLALTLRERLRSEREEVVVVELLGGLQALETRSFSQDGMGELSVDVVVWQLRPARRRSGPKAVKAALAVLAHVSRDQAVARPVVATKCGSVLAELLATAAAPEVLDVLEACASGFSAEAAENLVSRMQQTGVFRSPQNRVHSAALRIAAVLDNRGVSLATAVETLGDAKADAEVKEAAIRVLLKFACVWGPEYPGMAEGWRTLVSLTRTDATRLMALRALDVLLSRDFRLTAEDLQCVVATLAVATAQFAALRVLVRATEPGNGEFAGGAKQPLLHVLADAGDSGDTATMAVRLARIFWTSDAKFQRVCLDMLLSPLTQPSTVDELALFFRDFRAQVVLDAAVGASEAVHKHVACVLGNMTEVSFDKLNFGDALHVRTLGELGRRRRLAEPQDAAAVLRRISDSPTVDDLTTAAVSAWGSLVRGSGDLALTGLLSAVQSATACAQTRAALLDELTAAVAADASAFPLLPIAEVLLTNAKDDKDEGCRDAAALCLAVVVLALSVEMGERLVVEALQQHALFGLLVVRGVAQSDLHLADATRKLQVLAGSREHVARHMTDDSAFRVRQVAYGAGAALVAAGLEKEFFPETGHALLFPRILADVTVNQAYIKVVDLGPFKHKVDEGVGLRRAAATLCAALAKTPTEKTQLQDAVHGQKELHDLHLHF